VYPSRVGDVEHYQHAITSPVLRLNPHNQQR